MSVTWKDYKTGEMIEKHKGAVIKTGYQSWHDDWDELVWVWDFDENRPKSVIVHSTRFGCGDTKFTIDATDEVKALYNAWERECAFRKLLNDDYGRAHKITKGKTVVVTKGRKVPKGIKGLVFWEGTKRFGYSIVTTLGVAVNGEKDANGKWVEVVWVDANNVEVDNPDLTDEFELLAKAFNHFPMVNGF